MDTRMFQAMLERCGYTNISIEQKGSLIEYAVDLGNDRHAHVHCDASEFFQWTQDDGWDEIDALAFGMRHAMHECGQVLLEADGEWVGDGPVKADEYEIGFYAVPFVYGAQPVQFCPGCGGHLGWAGEEEFPRPAV